MNLPVVTLKGRSFASRVATSLINTLSVDELVTTNFDEYEKLAIKISNDKSFLVKIKDKIKANKKNSNLFNTSVYTKNIEEAYRIIYNKYFNKEPKTNIEL
jgi:predicted O-linked N-acetylglucosamine transferase (SPINDLY family)